MFGFNPLMLGQDAVSLAATLQAGSSGSFVGYTDSKSISFFSVPPTGSMSSTTTPGGGIVHFIGIWSSSYLYVGVNSGSRAPKRLYVNGSSYDLTFSNTAQGVDAYAVEGVPPSFIPVGGPHNILLTF